MLHIPVCKINLERKVSLTKMKYIEIKLTFGGGKQLCHFFLLLEILLGLIIFSLRIQDKKKAWKPPTIQMVLEKNSKNKSFRKSNTTLIVNLNYIFVLNLFTILRTIPLLKTCILKLMIQHMYCTRKAKQFWLMETNFLNFHLAYVVSRLM